MAGDDFEVAVFKTLSYLMECMKKGVVPSVDKAQEVSGCNDVYWAAVVSSMLNDKLVSGVSVDMYYDGAVDVSAGKMFSITMNGAAFLKENEKMKEAKKFLGRAFESVLATAIEATIALNFS